MEGSLLAFLLSRLLCRYFLFLTGNLKDLKVLQDVAAELQHPTSSSMLPSHRENFPEFKYVR